jgi:mono/diheme cytochrome c family protein
LGRLIELKKIFLTTTLVILTLAASAALSACAAEPNEQPAVEEAELQEIPQEYAALSNPLDGKATSAEEGGQIYNTNCASCHGPEGMGDGPAAKALDPKPKPLAQEGDLSDAYLYWRISEGGVMPPFRSVMPAWKNFLSEEQIWQVVTYLRTLMK